MRCGRLNASCEDSSLRKPEIVSQYAHLVPPGGAYASSLTRDEDAMDASGARRRHAACGRQRRVVLSPRRWGQVFSRCDFGLAAETQRSKRRRRLESPVLRGERAISRKPLRRECCAISALPDDLWAFSFSAHEDCGCG